MKKNLEFLKEKVRKYDRLSKCSKESQSKRNNYKKDRDAYLKAYINDKALFDILIQR